MVHGLLNGTDPLHLYRHDVESIFYVMLILAAHYEFWTFGKGKRKKTEIQRRRGLVELPLQRWFEQPSYQMLGESKGVFLSSQNPFELSPDFEDLRGWIEDILESFRPGIRSKEDHTSLLWKCLKG